MEGYKGAVYKSFPSAAEAQSFASSSGGYGKRSSGATSANSSSFGKSSSSVKKSGGISKSSGSQKTFSFESRPLVVYSGANTCITSIVPTRHTVTTSAIISTPAPSLCSSKPVTVVYTDGASRNNGKPGARAGYGVFYGDDDPRNVSIRLPATDKQTNQRAELSAIKHALKNAAAGNGENIHIHTDSKYSLQAFTNWGDTWEKNNYKNSTGQDVMNQDLIKEGRQLIKQVKAQGGSVEISYVKAHADNHGNNMADKLAVQGALKPNTPSTYGQ